MRHALLTIAVAAALVSAGAVVRGHRADDRMDGAGGALAVGGYGLIRSQAVDGVLVDDTYTATVIHRGDPALDDDAIAVTATLSSRTPDIRVIDGDLTFGSVRAGTSAPSRDAFTVRKRRGIPLDPSQIDWRISARPDTLVPPAWVGTWRVTTRFVDLSTGDIDAIDTFTETITAGDAIGLSAGGTGVRCAKVIHTGAFAISCELTATADGCVRHGRLDFAGTADEAVIAGRGAWTQTAIGPCGWFAASAGQRIEIDARRTTDAALIPPGGPATTLLMKFAHDPSILQFALR